MNVDERLVEAPSYEDDDPQWQTVRECMKCLTDKQQKVLELRYSMTGRAVMSTRDIAIETNTSQPSVVRTEKRAIDKLRGLVENAYVESRNRL